MGGLTLRSFLMASANGVGLMVLPWFLSMMTAAEGPSCHARGASTQARAGATATPVHGPGYLVSFAPHPSVTWACFSGTRLYTIAGRASLEGRICLGPAGRW